MPSTGSSSARPDRSGDLRPARRIYLDYAAFAPVDPRVLGVMRPFLEGWVGNPSARHSLGEEARESLQAARTKVGRLVGGRPDGVIFVSGATEANNLAIKGVALRGAGGHVVTTVAEHPSILAPCRDLVKRGFDVTFLPVDREGRVAPEAVAAALRKDTCLVTLAAANAEVGTVQPWRALAAVTRAAGVPLHVDGVGVLGRVPLAAEADGISLLTVASNDLYGPPGVGALWVRAGLALAPQILGGGQEGGLRAGTENLGGAVGLGVAAEIALREGAAEAARLEALRNRLLDGLPARCPAIRPVGARHPRLPHQAAFVVPGVKGESLLLGLDLAGISASSGTPCSAATGEPPHVLRAMGLPPRDAQGAIAFTLGRWTAAEEVDAVLTELPLVVERLRAASPFG
ncbi:MAG TPA: cysteine desulfurase family protein [Methylomirabilota bacterium]|nr:cysteine desulfurase family protein [Methylomirabilota bacterium]